MLLRHYLEQHYSVSAIAAELGCDRRTIQRWIAAGNLDRDPRDVCYGPRPPVLTKLDPYQSLIDTQGPLPRSLIYAFSEELSRPVGPAEVHRYEPTQRMCELIAVGGYEGVVYPSALGPGSNVVQFDPAAGRPVWVQYVRAESLDLRCVEIEDGEEVYEDSPFEELFDSGGGGAD